MANKAGQNNSIIFFLIFYCVLVPLLPSPMMNLVIAEDSNPLIIGHITDTVGPGAFFGVPSSIGARFAESEINSQGNKIEIIFDEALNQSTKGVSSATRLIEIEKVRALITDLTAVSVPVGPVAAQAKIIQVYNSPARSIAKQFSSAFSNFVDYQTSCRAIVSRWKKEGKRIAVVASNLEFGELCYSGALEADPEILAYRYDTGDDLRVAVTRLAAKGITAALSVGLEPDLVGFIRHCRSQSFKPVHGLVEIMLSKSLISAVGGESLEGTTIAGYADPDPDFVSRIKAFDKRIEEFPLASAAVGYNAVMAIHNAFSHCKSQDLSCLENEMKKPPSSGLLGFRGWGGDLVEAYPVVLKEYRAGSVHPIE